LPVTDKSKTPTSSSTGGSGLPQLSTNGSALRNDLPPPPPPQRLQQPGRRRLLKKHRGNAADEEEEEEEETNEDGDGSPLALWLKDYAGVGGRGFEVKLRTLGLNEPTDLLDEVASAVLTDQVCFLTSTACSQFFLYSCVQLNFLFYFFNFFTPHHSTTFVDHF
jgi:hypothetical protein